MSQNKQILEFMVTMITDQGQYLTLCLRQEIRTEAIDPVEMIRQRIDSIKDVDEDTRTVMKKILPALIPVQTAGQKIALSPIQMNITINRQIYERIGTPKVGEALFVELRKT
ncbi:MAG: hypothetical protein ACE5J2_00650 [Nitrososphaerales archaeon]